MRITTRGRYALRASLALAELGQDGRPVSINQLSEREDISPVFLEQIFFRLRKAGIVSSVRGPGGGFNFTRPLNELTIRELLDAAGEDLDISVCDKHLSSCNKEGACLSHFVWQEMNEMITNFFDGITIASILEKYRDRVTGSGTGNSQAVPRLQKSR
ncbi:MAG: RrF2 family transcriptional regulator [Treponema sp.]|nr:RrF2 family transcriptional regulator [Treponema sp.]